MSRRGARVLGAVVGLVVVCGVAVAHGGSLRDASGQELAVPTWLFLSTGGAVVGASFLLASFVTDREFVAAVHEWHHHLPAPRRVLPWVRHVVGLAGFAFVLLTGFAGPTEPLRNGAIVLVWVGWWAAFAMSTYLVGNSWPPVNPFRTLTRPVA
ncbi:hypothetical protein [Halobacterium sp. KA-6]|uniref:hypothetical protein n=1 Tax=Halobacterium sp. KA-6 TaxID=2896368 RepID=UPI002E7B332F|nr:hypothetical protein [Halobacterium sp. KA-6]